MLLLGLLVVFALSFGAANTPLSEVFNGLFSPGDEFVQRIIWQLRMPRTVLAFLAGSGLALAGLILQTVTRNRLLILTCLVSLQGFIWCGVLYSPYWCALA